VLAGAPSFSAPAPTLDPDAAVEPDAAALGENEDADDVAGADEPEGRGARVAVRPGDTLGHLAVEHYGYYSSALVDEIRRANPTVNERMLRVGQEIVLPRSDAALPEHLPGPGGATP
jgi:phage tail protein X